mmetsp:Transcript_45377/g.111293  ORF Transcript_45377/g.111293 Transcript_45377/m.111293 type:complete len:127 (-) Transcript_45377:43-423(-)
MGGNAAGSGASARPAYSEAAMAMLRAISELSHAADDFFDKVENSLNYNYDMAMAEVDYEQLQLKLEALEKAFDQTHTLNVCLADANKQPESVLQECVAEKSSAETDYQRLAQLASAALNAFHTRKP